MSFIENDAPMAPAVDAVNQTSDIDNLFVPAPADWGLEPDASSSLARWSNFKAFQIFTATGGNTLYANGYQQLKVIVLVQAANDGGVVVDISPEEWEAVQLFDAYTGKALPVDIIRDGEPAAWKCSLEPRGSFKPLPTAGELHGPVVRGKSIFLKEFYVSSNSPAPVKLIAAITRSDGQAFYSDEGSEYGHVSLKTVEPPVYRKEHYRLRRLSSRSPSTENVAQIDRYVLDLWVDQKFIKLVRCSVDGLLSLRSTHPDYLGYYAVAYFGGRKVHQGVAWETVDSVVIANEEPGKVTFLIHYAKRGGRSQVRHDHQAVRLFIQDMYGNKHEIDVTMTGSDSPTLEVV